MDVEELAAERRAWETFLGYRVVDQGELSDALCAAWDAPAEIGRRYCVLEPESGASIVVRFIETGAREGYWPLRVTIADYLRENHSVDPTRLRLIRRGVDLKSFSPESVSNERLIKRVNDWRLPDGQPVVMLPARLERRKGQSLLLEAVAKLGDLEFVCLLVGADSGRGNYRRELDELIQRYELAHRCVVLEHCDDMPAGYKVANVVVAAGSEPQSFVRTISEAQAMGRPVVTVDHGGAGEQVIAGHTAFLAPPNDAAGLASAIRRALELTEEQRERLAEEAITFTRRHFSRDEMCAQTLALYDEILRQAMAAAAS